MSNSIPTPYVSASKFSQFHYYLHRATLERAQDNLGTGTLASAARFSVGLVASLPIEVIKPWAQHGIPQDDYGRDYSMIFSEPFTRLFVLCSILEPQNGNGELPTARRS